MAHPRVGKHYIMTEEKCIFPVSFQSGVTDTGSGADAYHCGGFSHDEPKV